MSVAGAPPPPKQAPAQFQVIISTDIQDGKACPIVINVTVSWASDSAERFWKMATSAPPLFHDSAFFHVEPGHSVEFGISGDPTANHDFKLPPVNDERRFRNDRGTVSFVAVDGKPNSTRIAINLAENPDHDAEHFVPFAQVVGGLSTLGMVHTPRLQHVPEWELSYKYLHRGNSWLHELDPKTSLITAVLVRWDGGTFGKGSSQHVCPENNDYVQMVVGAVEAEVQHLEQIAGLSGGATLVVVLVVVGGVWGLVLCYSEWRKRRLLRYSRELEESGVEMVYDDDMRAGALDESTEDRGSSMEYDRTHVRC